MRNKKNIKTHQYKPEAGFTVLELIIATTVFSVILMVASIGIIQIGKNYYKGITSSRTQETARSIEDEITRAIQVSGNTDLDQSPKPADPNYNDPGIARAFCIGNVRYTYVLDSQLSRQAPNNLTKQHGMWMDIKLPGATCRPLDLTANPPIDTGTPSTVDTSPVAKKQRKEMLATNTRLSYFNVQQLGQGLYKVDIKVLYGADEVVDEKGVDTPTTNDDSCLPIRNGGQFCATAQLSTFVKRRL